MIDRDPLLTTHAFLRPNGDQPGNAAVYDLSEDDQARAFIEELRTIEAADRPNSDEPYWLIEVKLLPWGFIDSLPEHIGW